MSAGATARLTDVFLIAFWIAGGDEINEALDTQQNPHWITDIKNVISAVSHHQIRFFKSDFYDVRKPLLVAWPI